MRFIDTLPTEIICLILDLLPSWEKKQLSCVSKRLRAICIPSIFSAVRFEFSKRSFRALKNLSTSEIRHHVAVFKYVVPKLIKSEVLDFDLFKSLILTPEDYVDESKSLYDLGYSLEECPPYISIYHSLQMICKKQKKLVDSGIDQKGLSFAFQQFSQLRELTLHFCVNPKHEDWLKPYLDIGSTITEKSYEHHIQVVSKALSEARSSGNTIDTIHLSTFQLPNFSFSISDLLSLSRSLRELLSDTKTLRLTDSESAVDLLSHSTLGIHNFEMHSAEIDLEILKRFLTSNKNSIRSINLYDVQVEGATGQITDILREILHKSVYRVE